MKFEKVGVIGSGVMGVGVAQSLAQTNHGVVLVDLTDEKLEQSKKDIQQNIRFQHLFNKKEKLEDPKIILERIAYTTDYGMLKQVDFIVENTTEKWSVKENVFRRLEEVCPDDCVFAANTSCISITRLSSLLKNRGRIIGTHFMNPVPLMTTVECIRGHHTSELTIETTRELLMEMGKEVILVNDYPGFVSNRISHLLMNEAAFVVQDQVAPPSDVDEIFRKCYGHKMGPLETADLIGLDTVVYSLDVLYESYRDSKFRCCPLLRKMVEAGLCGKKSGQGFYDYHLSL
jgi:3-hydroxybutyryl-CoA dehydrogenase